MLIRNTWYVAAYSDEVSSVPLARRICNEPLVIFRGHNGDVAVLHDKCCHRGAALHLGEVVDQGIRCGYHGLVFDQSGRCVDIPGEAHIPERLRVRSFPVVEKDQMVWVWLGDVHRADRSSIIDYPYHGDAWPNRHAVMRVEASYLRLIDNLMDNRHVGYVHKNTIGGNDPLAFTRAEETFTPRPNGLNLLRWFRDVTPPPTYLRAAKFSGRVDRWADFEYIAPSAVLIWAGARDIARAAYATGQRDADDGFSARNWNFLTPETEDSCFYFWSVAYRPVPDAAAIIDRLYNDVVATFAEDKVVVELQQERLKESGEADLVDLKSDAVRLNAKRVLARMLAAETGSPT